MIIYTGMCFNSIIQVISGYRAGLLTKSVSIWRQLQRATIEFEMGHESSIGIIVGGIHPDRDGERLPGSQPSFALTEDLQRARHVCFVRGYTFICLWVISACLMSTIGLSPGSEGLYLIVPSSLAMACLSVPVERFLAALLDPGRIGATNF